MITVVNQKIDIDLPQLSEGYTVNPNDEPLFVKSLDVNYFSVIFL